MLKKTITYIDFDGNERKEDFYFNLSKAEAMEMELGVTGGMTQMLEKIVAERDNKRLIENFKEIILKSYGEKSPDGRRFIKSPELSIAFSQTQAYSDLFMELGEKADMAAAFINGIMPKHDGSSRNLIQGPPQQNSNPSQRPNRPI